jgi:hypothetical protein
MTLTVFKRGDIGQIFTDTLTAAGNPVDLSDCTVLWCLKNIQTREERTAPAIIVDAPAGDVEYVSQAADFTTAGVYRHEWQVTFTTGEVYTFPSAGWNTVQVVNDLNPPA